MDFNEKKEKLMQLFSDNDLKIIVEPLINNILNLEKQIQDTENLPFIRVHQKIKAKQKITPAARLYTALIQQYNASLKTLSSYLPKKENVDEKSPLRIYLEKLNQEK